MPKHPKRPSYRAACKVFDILSSDIDRPVPDATYGTYISTPPNTDFRIVFDSY